MHLKHLIWVTIFSVMMGAQVVHAACPNNEDGNPGEAGEVEYFSDDRLQYCDGTYWIDMVDNTLSDGLIGYWPFDGDATDASRNGGDAVPGGNGIFPYESSIIDQAMLVRNNGGLNITTTTQLNNHGQYTVAGWIFGMGAPGRPIISDGGSFSLVTRDISIGGLRFNATRWSGTNGQWQIPTGTIPNDEWTHIAVTYDYSSVANDPQLYLNGVAIAVDERFTPTGTVSTVTPTTGRIGWNGGTQEFGRLIDDLRVYNRILSPTEITELVEMGVDRGLVGHWKLDEGSGTTAADSSDAGNDITLTAVSFDANSVNGIISNGLDTNTGNTTTKLQVDNNGAYSDLTSMTFSFWINPDDFINGGEFLDIEDSIRINLTPGQNRIYVQASAWSGTSGSWNSGTLVTLTAGVWNHVVVTYDYNDPIATKPKIYINAVATSPGIASNPTGAYVEPAPASTHISARHDSSNSYVRGQLDDFRIYNRILSPTDITTLFKQGVNRDLVGHWKLDEGSGTTAADSSGNENDGTATSISFDSNGVTGIIGNALDFVNQNNDYILLPDLSSSDYTLTAWVNPRSRATGSPDFYDAVLSKGSEPGTGYFALQMASVSGNIRAVSTTSAFKQFCTGASAPPLNEWSHIVSVQDSINSEINLYINGALVQSCSMSGTVLTNTQPWRIGSERYNRYGVDGLIDDVRIYNRALSPSEIEILSGCPGPGSYYYNASDDVMQWCDGVNSSINMHTPAGGAGGCTTPPASEGSLNYDTDRFEACDGNGWLDIGK